jgi:LPXTG-motif cell wall-anchored protein
MKRKLASAVAMLLLTSGTALAATTPSTTAYHFSSHPMIAGEVVSVNDHSMVVNTDQGEQVTLQVDTRTMAPRDLAPGMLMRAEFEAMENCKLYAQRIVPIRGGMPLNRLQAYANTRDSRETIALNATGPRRPVYYSSEMNASQAGVVDTRETRLQTIEAHSPGAMISATPASADYVFSTRPMVTGRVLSVNDHQLVVVTDQGQTVGLVMDSRTMVPSEVAPGSIVRTEFKPMDDGRYYAQRLAYVGPGVPEREQAYAHTRDGDAALAANTMDCGCSTVMVQNTSSTVGQREIIRTEPPVAQNNPVPETLPQTASDQPLIGLLGVLSLALAGAFTLTRRLRRV